MPAGRPTKLTPKLRTAICEALRAGNYLEPSAILNGVSKSVVYDWLKRGAKEKARLEKSKRAKQRKKERPFVLFLDAIKKAQAVAEVRDVANIALAAKTQWQASAWRLERKNYERWGRKQNVEVTGEGGGPVEAGLVVKFIRPPETE